MALFVYAIRANALCPALLAEEVVTEVLRTALQASLVIVRRWHKLWEIIISVKPQRSYDPGLAA